MDDSAANKMKRSNFSPWGRSTVPGKTAVASAMNANVPSPEPARIVSDLAMPSTEPSGNTMAGTLAAFPKIQNAQKQWEMQQELQNKAAGESVGRNSSATPAANPPKRTIDASDLVKATARRFTEEAVSKRLAEINGPSLPASSTSLSPSKSFMNFHTGSELVEKIRADSMGLAKATSSAADKQSSSPATITEADAPKIGERLVPLSHTKEGRPYASYPLPEGGTVPGRGVLIPSNYKHHTHKDYPAICPVRTCRRVFAGVKGLGGHFAAAHCGNTFNDNGDGTLSKIGSYSKFGAGSSPAIIISQNPLPSDAPPPADPGVPYQAALAVKRAASSGSLNSLNSTPKRDSMSTEPAHTPAVTYLQDVLMEKQKLWKREDIVIMSTLPPLRKLPQEWIDAHTGTVLDLIDYACALAFVVGREVTGDERCKASTGPPSRPTSRLSSPCIALPYNINASAKRFFSSTETCVGCKYWSHLQRRSNSCCDWSPEAYVPKGSKQQRQPSITTIDTDDAGNESEQMDIEEPEPASAIQLKPSRPAALTRPRRAIVSSDESSLEEPPRKRRHISNPPTERQSSAVAGAAMQSGQLGGPDLEMEEWEIAPGRMRNEASSENVAFSNSYLTSGQPVTVSEDVLFNVLVIKPGASNHWSVEDDKLRTCSVTGGKIKVTIGSQPFNLGPNGMFVVRPGQTCKVENRLYVDATVHCTTIANYELR